MAFKKATKEQSKLRLAIMGPSGSGKTFTSLEIAKELGSKVAVIDSERGSASKYADLFAFDTCGMDTHAPQVYVNLIKEAEKAGYDVIIVDSLSHAWSGKGGALEQVDNAAKRSGSGNSFTAWRDVTPHHNALVDAILTSRCHVIVTMRTKQEYVLEENDRGKKTPKKVGMAPVQREGIEYEFDVIADMSIDHDFVVSKTRCQALDGFVARKPGAGVGQILKGWLENGVTPVEADPKPVQPVAGEMQSTGVANTATTATSTGAAKAAQAAPDTAKTGNADPKSTGTTGSNAGSGTTSNAGASTAGGESPKSATTTGGSATSSQNAQSQSSGTATVGAEEMKQLLAAGMANGWTRSEINAFLVHSFKLTATKGLTQKQWDASVRLLMRPENASNTVIVDSNGKALPQVHQWPLKG